MPTCVLICLVLLMDGFLSLIFYLQVFCLHSLRPQAVSVFSANQVEKLWKRGGGGEGLLRSEFSTLMIKDRVFQQP